MEKIKGTSSERPFAAPRFLTSGPCWRCGLANLIFTPPAAIKLGVHNANVLYDTLALPLTTWPGSRRHLTVLLPLQLLLDQLLE